MAGSPSLRLRKSATISLLPWITRPARGSLCPPHPTTSSQQTSLGFFGGSQPRKLEGGTYSAAKANRSSPVPWLPQASPGLLGWEE